MVTSNRESGFGRYDVMIEPLERGKNAVILEFKVHDPEEEETLKDTVAAALAQMKKDSMLQCLWQREFLRKEF